MQQLRGAPLDRARAAIDEARDDRRDDRVDECRRHRDRPAAHEAQVVRLEAARGDDGVAKGEEDDVVLARIRIGDRGELAGVDGIASARRRARSCSRRSSAQESSTRASSASASIGRKKSSAGASQRPRFGARLVARDVRSRLSVMARLLASRRRINSTDACHRFLRLLGLGQDDARRAAHRSPAPGRPARLGRQARAPRFRHRPRRQGLVAASPGGCVRGRDRVEPSPGQDARVPGDRGADVRPARRRARRLRLGPGRGLQARAAAEDRGLARGDRASPRSIRSIPS